MILTRVFAPEVMGGFFFSTALAFLVLLFTAFGTHLHLVRAVARDPERGLRQLGEVLALRLPLTALALLLLGAGALALAPALAPVVVLTAAFVLVGDFANSFGAFMTGCRHFRRRFLVALAGPVALLASVPAAVYAGASLEVALLCFVAASLVAVAVAGGVVRVRYGRFPLPRERGRLFTVAAACWPFVVLEALQVVQFKIDTLMVFWILSAEAAAQYETAYRLLEVARLAIRPLATIAFPVCALLFAQRQWAAARSYGTRVVLTAAALGGAVLPIGLVDPQWVMATVWGPAYAATGGILRILFLSAPLVFVGLVGVMIATALGQERRLMRLMGLATVFNVALNALAIPRLGPEGAAWTTLATELLIAIGLALTIRRAVRAARGPAVATCGAGARSVGGAGGS